MSSNCAVLEASSRALLGALFKGLIETLEILLRLLRARDLALVGLMESRIVDRNSGLRRQPVTMLFGALGENTGLGVSKKEPAQNLARTGDDRYGKIASHRKVTFRHAVMRRALAVAGIGEDVVRAHGAPPRKVGSKIAVLRGIGNCSKASRGTPERV